jgi:peptide/nickel transport system substrate-binding protein
VDSKRASALALSVVVLVVLMTACRGAGGEPQSLNYGLTLVPSGIDPHIHASNELGIPLSNVYDTLVFQDPASGEFVPGLATEWSVSADGLVYTFSLRKDVKFHDGTRFNAAAVQANLERVVDPNTGSQKARFMLGSFERAEVIDDYTVAIHLAAPYAPLLDSLSQVYLGMASPDALAEWGTSDYQFHQVGTGPYTFVEYVPGDHLTLARNPEYRWGPAFLDTAESEGVDEIVFRFYEDAATRAIALESGQADVMGEIPPQDARRLAEDDRFVLHPVAIPGQPLQLFINTTRPPTDELAVRRALITATDRATIVATIFGSWSPVAYAPLSAASKGYVADLEDWYPYDPQHARTLLEDAGWSDGDGDGVRERDGLSLRLDLYYMSWGMVPEVIQMLESAWSAVGVEVNAQLVSYPAALEAAANGEHHVMPFNLFGTDPSLLNNFYTTGAGFNWSKVADPELDRWLEEAAEAADPAARLDFYRKAQTRIMEQALIVPIRDYVNLNVATVSITDLSYDAQGWFPLLAEVRLEADR